MPRTFASAKCPDCRKVPYLDGSTGRLVCDCGTRTWWAKKGIRGTEEERAWLAAKGFEEATDVQGDVYYVGPLGHIIWLFDNGTWSGGKAPEGISLESYADELAKEI